MREGLRQHNCSLGVDHQRKVIFCGPDTGTDHIVLTTAVLYAWYAHQITTAEGIANLGFIKVSGHLGKDLVLTLADGYKIIFVESEDITVYGMILTEKESQPIYGFANCNTRKIKGTPFLYRKTVFISHSSVDKPTVREIEKLLKPHANTWFDENNIKVGDSISAAIDNGLENCDAIILCFSENTNSSNWVRREYSYAMHEGIRILPVRLDGTKPPPTLQDTNYIDFPGASTDQFVNALKKAIEQA
jgi:hypothetical protein